MVQVELPLLVTSTVWIVCDSSEPAALVLAPRAKLRFPGWQVPRGAAAWVPGEAASGGRRAPGLRAGAGVNSRAAGRAAG